MKKPTTEGKGIKEIVIPILNDEYKVIVCIGDYNCWLKTFKSWGYKTKPNPESITEMRGQCFHEKDCHPIIALRETPKTPQQIGTLAHEAFHAISNIWEKIDDRSHDEVFAHSIGAIVRITLNNL